MTSMKIEIYRPGLVKTLRLEKFLYKVNTEFEVPLTNRVDLSNYSDKLATLAYNIFIVKDRLDIGHSAFYPNFHNSSLFISSIAVVKTFHRKGLGTILISQIEEFAHEYDIRSLKLGAKSNSTELDRFYKTNGFQLEEKFIYKKTLELTS